MDFNWVDMLVIGPFLIAMSYNPVPVFMRVIGGLLIAMNVIFFMLNPPNFGSTHSDDEAIKPGPVAKQDYTLGSNRQGHNSISGYPNALLSRYSQR